MASVSLVGGGVAEAAPDASGAVQLGKQHKASATTRVTASHGDGLSGFAPEMGTGVLGVSFGGGGVTGFSRTRAAWPACRAARRP